MNERKKRDEDRYLVNCLRLSQVMMSAIAIRAVVAVAVAMFRIFQENWA